MGRNYLLDVKKIAHKRSIMDNKLIIVEGLPCVGKSTTSKYIAEFLEQSREKNIHVDEGTGNHPADYEFHAYIPEKIMKNLSTDLQDKIKKYARAALDGFIFPLKQAGSDIEKLMNYKIYDFIPWEDEMPVMLDGWKQFVETRDKEITHIFNCCVLQNSMCETMIRFNFSIEKSRDYISSIFKIIEEMNPLVIYLQCDNVEERIRNISKERDAQWLENVVDYHCNGEYGRSRNLKGFIGYIKCLEDRQKRELEILNTLPIDKLVIENPYNDWNATYEKIQSTLQHTM